MNKINQPSMKSCVAIIAFIISCMLQQNALAQVSHERAYQVELIIFSRNELSHHEAWPKNIKLAYPDNLRFLQSTESNNSEGFNLLPFSERMLNTQANTLARSGSYTLLFHQAWRQMIYAKNTHIFISGGKSFNGHQELEGNVSLSVGQYLKLQTNLWLTQFAPMTLDAAQVMPSSTASSSATAAENWPELPGLPNADASAIQQPQEFVTKRIVKINQQRSMRSNEVHYIDHPVLGIIIKIVPSAQ